MKRYWFLIALMLLILAACSPAETDLVENESEATPLATEEIREDEAMEPEEPDPMVVEPTAVEEESEVPEDEPEPTEAPQVEVAFPATNFAEAALLRDSDHFKGADEPTVEIIEYGDFQ